VWLEGEVVTRAEIWLGAVGLAPRAAPAAAQSLVGHRLDRDVTTQAAELAKKSATPMDNTDFQTQWRKAVVGRYVEAALLECAGLPPERLPRQ
jgi:CO/xanthine dehydrogenase FAD-binding subunit